MSKTVERLENLHEDRLEKSPPANEAPKEASFSKWGIVFWLVASITATVFSYQLGLHQGMQTVQEELPRQWRYYFNESFEKSEAPPVPAVIQPAHHKRSGEESEKSVPVRGAGFTIQVVTYRSETLAKQEVERLKKKGHDAFMVPAGNYYQVCIDLFKDKKVAMQKLIQLRTEKYYETYPGAFVKFLKQQSA